MSIGRKISWVVIYAAPVVVMIGLVTVVPNDWALAGIDAAIILGLFVVQHERIDVTSYFFGLIVMTFFEWFFVRSGVETFDRASLFGVMPVWLPMLWGYGFVAIRRSAAALGR